MLFPVSHVIDSLLLLHNVVELGRVVIRVVFAFICCVAYLLTTLTDLLNFGFIKVFKLVLAFVLFNCMVHIKFASRGILVEFAAAEVHFA